MKVTILELHNDGNYQGRFLVKNVKNQAAGFDIIKDELFRSFEKGSAKPWNKLVQTLMFNPPPITAHSFNSKRDLWVSFS